MLLYAIYTPAEVNSWNQQRYFAFASVESFVQAMGDYNNGNTTLEPIMHHFMVDMAVSTATLIRWNPETKYCEEAGIIRVSDNSMADNWDGTHHEIHLVERATDEKVFRQVNYA